MAISRSSLFVRSAFRKLPVEAIVLAVIAGAMIAAIHDVEALWPVRVALTGVLVGPLAVAAHRLGRRRQAALTAVLAAGILAALTAASPSFAAIEYARFRYPFALAFTAAVLAPFVAAADFTRFVRRFFEETTTWALLAICAFAAYGAIVSALRELFDLSSYRLTADGAIALAAVIVLCYVDRLLADDTAGRIPVLWRRLATAIGAPFVAIMLVILVAYEALALVRGELPRNMLSPLIVAAGLVGFVTTAILTAVLHGEVGTASLAPADPHGWARRPSIRLARAFPVVLLALLPMAGWALWIRLAEHGVTPFRAVRGGGLVCLGVLGLASALRWWRGRPPLTWQVPATVAGFALALGFGPLSAIELSIRSQAAVLDDQLTRDHLPRVVLSAGPEHTIAALPPARYEALARQLDELHRLGGVAALRRVLTGDVDGCDRRWWSCLDRLGITRLDRDGEVPIDEIRLSVAGRFPIATGAIEPFDLSRRWGASAPVLPPSTTMPVLLGDALAVRTGDVELARGSLVALVERGVSPEVLSTTHTVPAALIPMVAPDGAVAADLAVFELTVATRQGAIQVVSLRGVVIWRR